jgi:hypothetical protein
MKTRRGQRRASRKKMNDDQPEDSKEAGKEKIRERLRNARDPSLPGVRGSDVTPRRFSWLWRGHWPCGKVIEICGDPGVFKTGVTLDFCARLTVGAPFPGEPGQRRDPAKVLFFSAEDDPEDTLLPRFLAAGGNPQLIQFVAAIHGLPSLPNDENKLSSWVKSWQPALIVFDPIDAFFGAKVEVNSNPDARRALLPLVKVGSQTGATSVLIRHLNKDSKVGRAMYRSAGSIGITAAARASFILGPKPDDPDTYVFACTKLNGARRPQSIAYRVEDHVLDGGIKTQRAKWLGETAESSDDLVREPVPRPRGPSPDKRETAEAFLREALADGAWHPSKPIIAKAEERGIKYPTLKAALRALGGFYRKAGFTTGWDWSLPGPPNNPASSTDPNGEKDSAEDAEPQDNSAPSDGFAEDKRSPNGGERAFSKNTTYSATSIKNSQTREDAEFRKGKSATSAKPLSPNHFDNPVRPGNAEDAESRGAPDDADLF